MLEVVEGGSLRYVRAIFTNVARAYQQVSMKAHSVSEPPT